jgi:PST family polysaccharide transporter
MSDLKVLTARGGLYLGLRYGLGICISFGNMLVLTWMIGPHAYGLFVTVMGLSAFLASLARAGADTYLVRREVAPERSTYHVAFALIAACSAVLVLAGAGTVPALIHWYGSSEFVAPYLATLLTVPLAGLAGVPTAKLERELAFHKVAGIELRGQALALMVSLVLALGHRGVWAPVAGLIAWQAWAALGAMWFARLWPAFSFDAGELRAMLAFGVGYTMSQRVWQLRTLVNPLLVGKLAGAEGVAFVGLAIRLAEGLGFVRIAAGRLAVAGLARLRSEPQRLRAALQTAIDLQVLSLGIALSLFGLAAPWVVEHVMGSRWTASLTVYPWVAAGVLINSVYNLQASALFVLGAQWPVFRGYAMHILILAAGAWFLIPALGITGYGCADILAVGGYAVLHRALGKRIGISYRSAGLWVFACTAALVGTWTKHVVPAIVLWTPLCAMAVIEARNRMARRRCRQFRERPLVATAGD